MALAGVHSLAGKSFPPDHGLSVLERGGHSRSSEVGRHFDKIDAGSNLRPSTAVPQVVSAARSLSMPARRGRCGGDSLSEYLQVIRKVPLLDAAEEVYLGRTIQDWLTNPNPCKLVERRGKKARDQMISANLRLVVKICKRYQYAISHLQLDLLDLIQAGNLGLIKAVERFDPTRGYKLSTFAFWWIRQSVQRAMRELGSAIRIPRSMAQLTFRAHDLQAASDVHLLLHELAEKLGEEQQRLETSLHVVRQCRTASLDAPIADIDGTTTLMDVIRDSHSLQPEDDYRWLHEQLNLLSERERQVIQLRYQEGKGSSLRDVAGVMGLTKSQVQGIERKAFNTLRSRLTTILNPC